MDVSFGTRFLEFARHYLPLHKRIYLSVMAITVLSQIIWPTAWWFFWPLIIWTMAFGLHFMVIRTLDVQDDWVEERTDQISENAFDFSHIATIRKQMSKETYGEAYGSEKKPKADEKPPI